MFLTLAVALVCPVTWAGPEIQEIRDVQLFQPNGEMVEDYHAKALGLRPGDRITFPEHYSRIFVRKLGQGSTSIVFENELGWASRIPLNPLVDHYIEQTRTAYPALFNGGAQIPYIYLDTHIPFRHLETELLDLDKENAQDWLARVYKDNMSVDFFSRFKKAPALSHLDELKYRELIEYFKSLARFMFISDSALHNVKWDRRLKKWFLIDWTSEVVMEDEPFRPGVALKGRIFDYNKELYDQIIAAVKAERRRLHQEGRFILCKEKLLSRPW